ncbi:MAG: hypothetical protein FGM32_03580 [Candidatus Kapabacteria bacterium]|nr:hypothetical protein [Candidatus Kapabacteria bacterium]
MTLLLVFLLCASVGGLAQNIRDSRGNDFWLAVPPNDNSSVTASDPAFVSLLVATDTASTTVKVYARRRTGVTDTIVAIAPPSTLWEIRLSQYALYQLQGVENVNGPSPDGEKPSPASIHVTTSHDISLYAVLRAPLTSDAWLVLPTDALSTDYIVTSYTSDVSQSFGSTVVYPSQFLVVATEDSTAVDITLRPDRSDRALGRNRSVMLKKGESYLLQARVENSRRDDLTGSLVTSNRPVVVLSGHRRAQVPVLSSTSSRDCLIEQLPGIETWGRDIIVPPLELPVDASIVASNDVSVCRVVAANDSTLVTVNSQPPYLLNKGSFWDLPLDQALVFSSTKPILASIIDRSANRSGGRLTGDPSMIIVPPVEQYLKSYIVGSVGPNANGRQLYTTHNISVIVPTAAVPSLTLDGSSSFMSVRSIIGTDYSIASAIVPPGAHRVRADSAFGIFVYGYGPAESYGYTGGMAFERLYDPVIRLRALDAAGNAGQRDTVAIIVDSVDKRNTEALAGMRSVQFRVQFDATSFVSRQPVELDSMRTVASMWFTKDIMTIAPGDTLAMIIGNHTLGIADSSAIVVDSATWYSGDRKPLRIVTKYVPGALQCTNVCESGDKQRLFDPRVPAPVMRQGYYDIRGSYVGPTLDGLPPGIYIRR